jgi:hypothetical protein
MKMFSPILLAAGLLTAGQLLAADGTAAAPLRKIAIIVENRAGAQFNDKVPVLEDLVASRIAGKGYTVISRDVAINALKSYSTVGVNVTSQSAVNATAGNSSSQQATAKDSAKAEVTRATALHAKDSSDPTDPSALSLEAAQKDSAHIKATQQHSDNSSGQASGNLNVAQSRR